MKIKLANSLGFCFGVKRAIKLAEENPGSTTIGPIIHNPKEIKRLKDDFNIDVTENIEDIKEKKQALIRTHGVPKKDYQKLIDMNIDVIDATCPFVAKPQQICQEMDKTGYDVVIFGDKSHPEIKGIMSYAKKPIVVLFPQELKNYSIGDKVAVISQTTKKEEDFLKIVKELLKRHKEIRVFNTICNATFENQNAATKLSKEVDIMIIIGGKNSSNTKQLFNISQGNCKNSYLIEDVEEIKTDWFRDKNICGITAGASTPQWLIEKVKKHIELI